MKVKIINTAFIYSIPPAVSFTGTIFLVFAGNAAFSVQETIIGFVIFFLSGITFVWTAYYLSRFIYGKIDLSRNALIYGNLFFKREIEIENVVQLGRFFLSNRVLRIAIDGKVYFIQTFDDHVADLFGRSQKDMV